MASECQNTSRDLINDLMREIEELYQSWLWRIGVPPRKRVKHWVRVNRICGSKEIKMLQV